MSALLVAAAVTADTILGEPRRAHPLVAFGRYARWLEARLHPGETAASGHARWRGVLALLLAVAPPTLLCVLLLALLSRWPLLAALVEIMVLYFTIGHRSLREHARAVSIALYRRDTAEARHRVSMIVSRDCTAMNETQIAAATIESVLENGSDAVFGSLFWFAVAGAPGALAYRLANTLDAMWGYRTPRLLHFGFAAAKFDDALNWIPARLTALSYALATLSLQALRCWRMQAPAWDSPNGGPVMAAGAGALGLQLGGAACYHGVLKQRPTLGEGRVPQGEDIDRALSLLLRALMIWLAALLLLSIVLTRYEAQAPATDRGPDAAMNPSAPGVDVGVTGA